MFIDLLHVCGNAANLEDKTKEIFASVKKILLFCTPDWLYFHRHASGLKVRRSLNHSIGTRTVTQSEKYLIFNNEDVHESPVEGAFKGNFACEVEATKSIKHILKKPLKSSKNS